MKLGKIFAAALLGLTLASTPVIAQDVAEGDTRTATPQTGGQAMCQCPCAMMGGGMMMGGPMMQSHQLMQEAMGMLKETMSITKDISNKPTAAQKARLEAMTKRMDEIMKQHDQMMAMKQGGCPPAAPQGQKQ